MQIVLVCSRRHWRKKSGSEGREREIKDGLVEGGARERETPKGSAGSLVSEVEGGVWSCLGSLCSTDQHTGLKTSLSLF